MTGQIPSWADEQLYLFHEYLADKEYHARKRGERRKVQVIRQVRDAFEDTLDDLDVDYAPRWEEESNVRSRSDSIAARAATADIHGFVQECLGADDAHPHEINLGKPVRRGRKPATDEDANDYDRMFAIPEDSMDHLPHRPFPGDTDE